jgi:hypothetical protein
MPHVVRSPQVPTDLGHRVGRLTHQRHGLPLTETLRYTDVGFLLAWAPPISQFSPYRGVCKIMGGAHFHIDSHQHDPYGSLVLLHHVAMHLGELVGFFSSLRIATDK